MYTLLTSNSKLSYLYHEMILDDDNECIVTLRQMSVSHCDQTDKTLHNYIHVLFLTRG